MWDAGQAGHGRPVGVRTKAAQVFYADGDRTSTALIRAVLHHLRARVTHFEDPTECLASLKAGACDLLISNTRRPGRCTARAGTIEVHRSHIMRKLQVDGMVDLVRRCAQLGLLRNWP
jgi:FixJ family two-component response regulator